MKKTWQVAVNGVEHTIGYKTGMGGAKVIVDEETFKVKSQNWFVMMVDYPIEIDGTEVRVVVIGGKADLAVNGVYRESGEAYQPLHKVPAVSHVFLGISCIAGFLLCGWLGLAIGILFGTIYIRKGLAGKMGAVIGSFIGCTVIQLIIMFAVLLAM